MPAYPESKAFARSRKSKSKDSNYREIKNYFLGREKSMKKNYGKVDKLFSKNPWNNNHEYLRAVINASAKTQPVDFRLQRASGVAEGHQSEGGFLIKKELMDTFLYGETGSDLYRRCTKIPVGEGFRDVDSSSSFLRWLNHLFGITRV